MALPTILINNSTGSDTAASGAGPATAITGTAAAHTGGSASTTITLTNSPDLSGVAADGSHCLWLATPSGRQFSKITAVDDGADTVTVEDSFNIESGSAVNYAIGGKRAGLDSASSRTLLGASGLKAGWIVEVEYTGATYELTSELAIAASGGTLRGSGAERPLIRYDHTGVTATLMKFTAASWAVANLKLERTATNSSNNAALAHLAVGGEYLFRNCDILQTDGQAGQTVITRGIWGEQNSTAYRIRVVGCYFEGCSHGIDKDTGQGNFVVQVDKCRFKDCYRGVASRGTGVSVTNSLFTGCNVGILAGTLVSEGFSIRGNAFHDIDSHAVSILIGSGHLVEDNIFSEVGGNAVNVSGGTGTAVNRNAYYLITSGPTSGVDGGPDDMALTADPFVDAANGDFNLNDTAGGGAVLRGVEVTL